MHPHLYFFKKRLRRIIKFYTYFLASLLELRINRITLVLSVLTIGYILSPIDIIPDFIPILGLLDELVIVPSLIFVILKTISIETTNTVRQRARLKFVRRKKITRPLIAFFIIPCIWIFIFIIIFYNMN